TRCDIAGIKTLIRAVVGNNRILNRERGRTESVDHDATSRTRALIAADRRVHHGETPKEGKDRAASIAPIVRTHTSCHVIVCESAVMNGHTAAFVENRAAKCSAAAAGAVPAKLATLALTTVDAACAAAAPTTKPTVSTIAAATIGITATAAPAEAAIATVGRALTTTAAVSAIAAITTCSQN